MAVASLVGCSFCLDLGYFMAHNEGLDLAKAREVPRWRAVGGFHAAGAGRHGVRRGDDTDHMAVTDELSARLLAALGPAAMVELTAYIALANFVTRFNSACGIKSQGFAAACGLQPIAVASTA